MKTTNFSTTTILNKKRLWLSGLVLVLQAGLYLALSLHAIEPRNDRIKASVSQSWVQRYSEVTSNAADQAYYAAVDPPGDVIVTGYTDNGANYQDILTIKYSGVNGAM